MFSAVLQQMTQMVGHSVDVERNHVRQCVVDAVSHLSHNLSKQYEAHKPLDNGGGFMGCTLTCQYIFLLLTCYITEHLQYNIAMRTQLCN